MTWQFEHSADSAGSTNAVWQRYSNVARWSEWSPGVQWATLEGVFAIGSKGKSKPPGSWALRFRITAVDPERMFATASRLPGARLTFEHVIDPREAGVRITHRARLDGPFAALYARRVRALTQKNLTEGVERLAAQAAVEII